MPGLLLHELFGVAQPRELSLEKASNRSEELANCRAHSSVASAHGKREVKVVP